MHWSCLGLMTREGLSPRTLQVWWRWREELGRTSQRKEAGTVHMRQHLFTSINAAWGWKCIRLQNWMDVSEKASLSMVVCHFTHDWLTCSCFPVFVLNPPFRPDTSPEGLHTLCYTGNAGKLLPDWCKWINNMTKYSFHSLSLSLNRYERQKKRERKGKKERKNMVGRI